MSFDFERKRTPQEIYSALLSCADAKCEECCFFEPDAPTGYSACHDWMLLTQAAEYIREQMIKKNRAELAEHERKTGKWIQRSSDEWYCSECEYDILTWGSWELPKDLGYNYCPKCGTVMRGDDENH